MAINFIAGPLTNPTNRIDLPLGNYNDFEEPNLTVNNRLDPGNIAISSHNHMLVSSDFFANFNTSTYPVPANTFPGGDTWADFDAQGRLFWTNLVHLGVPIPIPIMRVGVGVTQVNPITGLPGPNVMVQNTPLLETDDRQALAADSNPNSPFANNIYTIWTRFRTVVVSVQPLSLVTRSGVFIGRSNDQGATWNLVQVGDSNGPDNTPNNADDEGLVQNVTIHVAPNGDVYGAYHAQPGFVAGQTSLPDGTSGQVFVVRSTDGGLTFPQKTLAFEPGQADITFNRQENGTTGNLAGTQFLTQGSVQPVVLADQVRPGNIYVFAVDDPDNNHGNGDDADLVFARSTDHGNTWTRRTIATGPPGGASYQLFPTANVDQFGNMIVGWYDNRRGLTNTGGNFLFDFFAMYSTDGGRTFSAPFMINDPANPFDPDETPTTPYLDGPTTRIGEYFGMDLFGGTGYVVWNGNTPNDTATSQQPYFDAFAIAGALTVTGDDSGVSDDVIEIGNIATNPDFMEVHVNGQRQYAGLREALSGDITVAGGLGDDEIYGGDDDDVIRGDLNLRSPQLGGQGGADSIYGGAGDDRIGGKGGHDHIFGEEGRDSIWGDGGDDLLEGGFNDDFLSGDAEDRGTGNDSLLGNEGFDILVGGRGEDILRGGPGQDYLTGDTSGNTGGFSDTFVLAVSEGTDLIFDFELGTDLIGLTGLLDLDDLEITMGSSSSRTLITIESSGEILADLFNVNYQDLIAIQDDTFIPDVITD